MGDDVAERGAVHDKLLRVGGVLKLRSLSAQKLQSRSETAFPFVNRRPYRQNSTGSPIGMTTDLTIRATDKRHFYNLIFTAKEPGRAGGPNSAGVLRNAD